MKTLPIFIIVNTYGADIDVITKKPTDPETRIQPFEKKENAVQTLNLMLKMDQNVKRWKCEQDEDEMPGYTCRKISDGSLVVKRKIIKIE